MERQPGDHRERPMQEGEIRHLLLLLTQIAQNQAETNSLLKQIAEKGVEFTQHEVKKRGK